MSERKNDAISIEDLAADIMERNQQHLRLVEGEQAAKDDEARALELTQMTRSLRARGVPLDHADSVTKGVLFGTPSLAAAKAWMHTPATLLVLAGKPGCGKTQAAAWCVAKPPTQKYSGLRAPSGVWPSELRPRFVDVTRLSRLSRYDEAVMLPLEECALLAIDDMGSEYVDQKGFFHSLLDGLINARHAERLKTVITTNLNRKAFDERYGKRIASRINAGIFHETNADDLRGPR